MARYMAKKNIGLYYIFFMPGGGGGIYGFWWFGKKNMIINEETCFLREPDQPPNQKKYRNDRKVSIIRNLLFLFESRLSNRSRSEGPYFKPKLML